MPEYRSCEFCRGERPLYAKQPCPPYHLQLWIRDGRLELDGILGSRVHNKNFLAPISISCRIFFCPVCGTPVGEFPPSQVIQSCYLCEEGTDWVRVSAPANLYLYFSNSTLHLVADLGYYDRNFIAVCSYCDEIPIHFCMNCGRRVSKLPAIPLGRFPGAKPQKGGI